MTFRLRSTARLALLALALSAACTVKDTDIPGLAGPSEFAQSIVVTASPDSIARDGGSQSSIMVTARDANGAPMSGVSVRMDMIVGGQLQDFGTLQARNIVTGSDGRARTIYTAPPPGPASGSPVTLVTILAQPVGSNFQNAIAQSAEIRLTAPGVILPPAGTPTASFTVTGSNSVNLPMTFDASGSQPGSNSGSITSYAWTFGDGSTGTGRTVNHTFTSQDTFNVTLTVTNDRGLAASVSKPVSVTVTLGPGANFVFGPTVVHVGDPVLFNASTSFAQPGRRLVSYEWDFGDGTSGGGVTPTHAFSRPGNFEVTLTVTDDLGQDNATDRPVTVLAPQAPIAAFVFSPSAPQVGQSVLFNAGTSTAATGRTIVNYAWNFGDGDRASGVTPSHAFTASGTYNVVLTLTDDAGATGSTTQSVQVGTASAPTAAFVFSPSAPQVGQSVLFNAGTSTVPSGRTIVAYAWNFGDGGTSSGVTTSHPFAVAGTYNVVLTVTDDLGRTGTASQAVTVSAASSSLVAKFTVSPGEAVISQPITVDASTSTVSGATIVDYAWNFGDSTVVIHTSSPLMQHTYFLLSDSAYTITLTITDNLGNKATATKEIEVTSGLGQPANAKFTISANPASVNVPVTFDASASTVGAGGGVITAYTWNFGDSATLFTPGGASTDHTYTASGAYTVTLTVTTSVGNTGTITKVIVVQ